MTKRLTDKQKLINKLVRDAFKKSGITARREQKARLRKWLMEVKRAKAKP